jgi:3-hydroxybutyryl-CoA dehydratase
MEEKPELNLSLLEPGGTFRPFVLDVTEDFIRAFEDAVNDDDPIYLDDHAARDAGFARGIAPAGIAGIWGRRSYLEDFRMPGGGILVRLSYEFERPVYVGDTITARAVVKEISERKGRPLVRIRTEAENQRGERIGAVELLLIWPR